MFYTQYGYGHLSQQKWNAMTEVKVNNSGNLVSSLDIKHFSVILKQVWG